MGTYSITAIAVDAEGREKMSKARELVVDSPTPTSITTVKTDDESDARAYNLMGVPVSESNLRPGIYIKNGRKIVIKP